MGADKGLREAGQITIAAAAVTITIGEIGQGYSLGATAGNAAPPETVRRIHVSTETADPGLLGDLLPAAAGRRSETRLLALDSCVSPAAAIGIRSAATVVTR